MKGFEFDGTAYPSARSFCRARGVDYNRFQRLCRKYRRAQECPEVAAAWCLGEPIPDDEPMSIKYRSDLDLAQIRKINYNRRREIGRRRSLHKAMFE